MSRIRDTDDYGVDCWPLDDEAVIKQAERHLQDTGHWPHGHTIAVLVARLKEKLS